MMGLVAAAFLPFASGALSTAAQPAVDLDSVIASATGGAFSGCPAIVAYDNSTLGACDAATNYICPVSCSKLPTYATYGLGDYCADQTAVATALNLTCSAAVCSVSPIFATVCAGTCGTTPSYCAVDGSDALVSGVSGGAFPNCAGLVAADLSAIGACDGPTTFVCPASCASAGQGGYAANDYCANDNTLPLAVAGQNCSSALCGANPLFAATCPGSCGAPLHCARDSDYTANDLTGGTFTSCAGLVAADLATIGGCDTFTNFVCPAGCAAIAGSTGYGLSDYCVDNPVIAAAAGAFCDSSLCGNPLIKLACPVTCNSRPPYCVSYCLDGSECAVGTTCSCNALSARRERNLLFGAPSVTLCTCV